jgi:hypothetical protein
MKEQAMEIEAIPPQQHSGLHIYTLRSAYSKETLNLSATELLQLAAFVESHAERLLDEARQDGEHVLHNAPQRHQEDREGRS